ncbi:hypothetical protein [Chitinolyticbacter albus]|uniref:hypothetical protein n=1 Tax=Chitinolyticbacter albus TaxID=2961951 RepID=UPI00210A7C65|nr:hypothetical protein [Chitinolyticbacter albus]
MYALACLLSALAALPFYLSSPNQRLLPAHRPALHGVGYALLVAALLLGTLGSDFASGLFATLTALMLAMVALPYLALARSGAA